MRNNEQLSREEINNDKSRVANKIVRRIVIQIKVSFTMFIFVRIAIDKISEDNEVKLN